MLLAALTCDCDTDCNDGGYGNHPVLDGRSKELEVPRQPIADRCHGATLAAVTDMDLTGGSLLEIQRPPSSSRPRGRYPVVWLAVIASGIVPRLSTIVVDCSSPACPD